MIRFPTVDEALELQHSADNTDRQNGRSSRQQPAHEAPHTARTAFGVLPIGGQPLAM